LSRLRERRETRFGAARVRVLLDGYLSPTLPPPGSDAYLQCNKYTLTRSRKRASRLSRKREK
ncbi:MAG: hypothetical protein ACRCUI_09825, partial [Polymorphobacter sp.]